MKPTLILMALWMLAPFLPAPGAQAAGSGLPGFLNLTVGVDIRDVARYKAPFWQEAEILLASMAQNPERYFPADTRFSRKGVVKETRLGGVYGIEMTEAPVDVGPQETLIRVLAYFNSQSTGWVFRKYAVSVGGEPRAVLNVRAEGDTPLGETRFSLKVGLLQRLAVLEEPRLGILKAYPLSVGGFDEGVTQDSRGRLQSVTYLFPKGSLKAQFAMRERTEPSYYKGRPFIRISGRDGGWSAYGFHVNITDRFIRGFESHGCMRMQEKDLYELYSIVTGARSKSVALSMSYWMATNTNHPLPLETSRYQRIKNFGTMEKPMTQKDEHDLLVMEVKKGQPRLDQFLDEEEILDPFAKLDKTVVEEEAAAAAAAAAVAGGSAEAEIPESLIDPLAELRR